MEDLKELKKIDKFADQCMKCGFCSFFCPVYQEEKVETAVARGKNYLVRQVLAGNQKFTPEMADIIGKCLLCKRCAANCPAKTQIDRVVVGARAQMVKEKGLGFIKNFAFRKVMANRKAFGRYVKMAKAFQFLMPKNRREDTASPGFPEGYGTGQEYPGARRQVFERPGETGQQIPERTCQNEGRGSSPGVPWTSSILSWDSRS